MRIPEYSNQVAVNTPLARPMQVEGPKVPDVLPASYGTNVGEATAQLGRTVQAGADVIENHIVKQQALNEEVMREKSLNSFKQQIQISNYDQTPEEYKDSDGVTRSRPKGVFLQVGEQAKDGFVRTRSNMAKLVNDYAAQIPNERVRAKFLAEAQGYQTSIESAVLSHEGQQYRVTQGNTMKAALINLTNEAATARDPEVLNNLLVKVAEKSNLLSDTQGDTSDIRQITMEKSIAGVVERAVLAKMEATGSDAAALSLLNSVSVPIPEVGRNNIEAKVREMRNIKEKEVRRFEAMTNRDLTIKAYSPEGLSFLELESKKSFLSPTRYEHLQKMALSVGDKQVEYTDDYTNKIASILQDAKNYAGSVKQGKRAYSEIVIDGVAELYSSGGMNKADAYYILDVMGIKDVSGDVDAINTVVLKQAKTFEKGLKSITTFAKMFIPNQSGELASEFVQFAAKNKIAADAQAAETFAKQKVLSLVPGIASGPKEGKVYYDRVTGAKVLAYPDGTLTAVPLTVIDDNEESPTTDYPGVDDDTSSEDYSNEDNI